MTTQSNSTAPETGELQPCPFCGGPGTMTTGRSAAIDARPFFNPACNTCDYVFAVGFFHVEDAVAAWNTRVNSHAELERERDALATALRELMNWGVEFDDERLNYISVQVDRDAIKDAQRALGETK